MEQDPSAPLGRPLREPRQHLLDYPSRDLVAQAVERVHDRATFRFSWRICLSCAAAANLATASRRSRSSVMLYLTGHLTPSVFDRYNITDDVRWPVSFIATFCDTPARTRFRTAVLRKSWGIRPRPLNSRRSSRVMAFQIAVVVVPSTLARAPSATRWHASRHAERDDLIGLPSRGNAKGTIW